MKAKLVYENIEFERGIEPAKAMDIGIIAQNRDPIKRKANFEASNPEVTHSSMSTSSMIAPGKHPKWEILSWSLYNPDDSETLKERENRYVYWFEKYTDYEIIEIESFDRRWHPWGDKEFPENYTQSFSVKMRNEKDES